CCHPMALHTRAGISTSKSFSCPARVSMISLFRQLATAGSSGTPGPNKGRGLPQKKPIPNVDKILLVGSGKGGVGKSTVSVNLAVAMATAGYRVGLADADIQGPSLATLLGLRGRRMEAEAPPAAGGGRPRLLPVEAHGLHCSSMSLLIPEGRAPVWRGHMLTNAVSQLLSGVAWPRTDVLLVDLPPGSGDVPLSVAQSVPAAACLLVATAQRVAVADVARHVDMMAALRVPVLGVVHNMAAFRCPACSARHPLFNSDALGDLIRTAELKLLAELELEPGDAQALDDGRPSFLACPKSPNTAEFASLAASVARLLQLPPQPAAV
ncbi:hypothetical protein BOX15_Mlig001429g2, partial [Macrostomum lignano]